MARAAGAAHHRKRAEIAAARTFQGCSWALGAERRDDRVGDVCWRVVPDRAECAHRLRERGMALSAARAAAKVGLKDAAFLLTQFPVDVP
jgi:hypothetical protein